MYMMYIQKWSFYKILPSRTHAKRLTFVKKSPFRPKQKFEVLLYLWSVPNMIPNRKKEPDLTSQERKRIISWLLDARIWKKARCGWRSGYFPGLAKTFATFFCTAVQAWCQLKRVVCGLEPAINSVRREYGLIRSLYVSLCTVHSFETRSSGIVEWKGAREKWRSSMHANCKCGW